MHDDDPALDEVALEKKKIEHPFKGKERMIEEMAGRLTAKQTWNRRRG